MHLVPRRHRRDDLSVAVFKNIVEGAGPVRHTQCQLVIIARTLHVEAVKIVPLDVQPVRIGGFSVAVFGEIDRVRLVILHLYVEFGFDACVVIACFS